MVSVDNATIIRAIALVVVAIFALQFFHSIVQPLTAIFIAFFLALALNPAVSWIARHLKDKSRVRATGAAYILVITILVGFIALVVPPLVRQTSDFIQNVPDTIQTFKQSDTALSRFVRANNLDKQLDHFSKDFGNKFKESGKPALSAAGTILSTVATVIAIFVLTFMMLVEGPTWIKRFFAVQPADKREHRRELATKMYRVVTGYVNGQVLVALIGGGFTTVALFITSSIYDVSINPLALGGIVMLTALMPLIGNIIGYSLVTLACLLVSAPLALTMAIFFIVYGQIENVTIQPTIQSRTNNLTPLTVFIAALLGVGFGGILGALVAIPIAGCLRVLVDDYYSQKTSKSIAETK